MNYEPNTTVWKVGDIVIHDADAKRMNMLMKVIERRQDATGRHLFICAYIDKQYHMTQKGFNEKEYSKWNRWTNSIKSLHNPNRFDFYTPTQTKESEKK